MALFEKNVKNSHRTIWRATWALAAVRKATTGKMPQYCQDSQRIIINIIIIRKNIHNAMINYISTQSRQSQYSAHAQVARLVTSCD